MEFLAFCRSDAQMGKLWHYSAKEAGCFVKGHDKSRKRV